MSHPTRASGDAAPATMRAVVVTRPGGLDTLEIRDVPVPAPQPGWVQIKVKAIRRQQVRGHHPQGRVGPGGHLPARAPASRARGSSTRPRRTAGCAPGQQVATMMGGMGRSFDGSYAQYVTVPAAQVIAFETSLPWDVAGALPEMFQTAYGSLTTGLDLQAGQTLLIRGGTSTVGLSAATMAKDIGATVISTTRHAGRADELLGTWHRPANRGRREDRREGPGPRAERRGRRAGTGGLHSRCRTPSDACAHTAPSASPAPWGARAVPDFTPFMIPNGVRLTSYAGEATDLPAQVFAQQLQAIANGRLKAPVAKIYRGLEQVRDAQASVESGTTPGKHVVLLDD